MHPPSREPLRFHGWLSKLYCFFPMHHLAYFGIIGCLLQLPGIVDASPTMSRWQPTIVLRQPAESSTAEPSAANLLREQLANPKEVLAVLLLLGGDIIQKAIAQNAGRIITPVAFSFGWVSYALISLLSIFGEGLLMPDSDSSSLVINPQSRNIKQNESWMLGRLIRDLEIEFDAKHKENEKINKMPLVITRWNADTTYRRSEVPYYQRKDSGYMSPRPFGGLDSRSKSRQQTKTNSQKTTRSRGHEPMLSDQRVRIEYTRLGPQTDWVWWSYVPVLIAELLIAAIPPCLLHHETPDWRILFITIAGNVLSLLTASIQRWQTEKFSCRATTGAAEDKPMKFILTRGNSHRHVFVIYVKEGIFSHNLEDLAVRRRDAISIYVRVMFAVLAVFWLFLLIAIGGLEEDTWFLLVVGTIGMIHSVIVAGAPREAKAHGIPLKLDKKQEILKMPEDDIQDVMGALISAEKREPGIGYALLDTFFPGGPRWKDEEFWEEQRIAWERRRGNPKYLHPAAPTTGATTLSMEQSTITQHTNDQIPKTPPVITSHPDIPRPGIVPPTTETSALPTQYSTATQHDNSESVAIAPVITRHPNNPQLDITPRTTIQTAPTESPANQTIATQPSTTQHNILQSSIAPPTTTKPTIQDPNMHQPRATSRGVLSPGETEIPSPVERKLPYQSTIESPPLRDTLSSKYQ